MPAVLHGVQCWRGGGDPTRFMLYENDTPSAGHCAHRSWLPATAAVAIQYAKIRYSLSTSDNTNAPSRFLSFRVDFP